MGGAIGAGNTHPVAEFNIEVDPEAARMVFQSGVHVVMVPLEVGSLLTRTALCSLSHVVWHCSTPVSIHSVSTSTRLCCAQVTHTTLVTREVFARIEALNVRSPSTMCVCRVGHYVVLARHAVDLFKEPYAPSQIPFQSLLSWIACPACVEFL